MSSCWPYRCSSHWWNAVPRRAWRAGGRGIGRRTCRASSAGSRASVTSDDTDSLAGSGTWVAPSPRRCARSASSRPASRSQASASRSARSAGADSGGAAPPDGGGSGRVVRPGQRCLRRGRRPRGPPRALTRRGDRPVGRVHARRAAGSPRRAPAHRPTPTTWATPDCAPPPGTATVRAGAAALAPPVAGAAQPERGPGRGHVHQPALLGQVPGRARLAEGLERGSVQAEELRQVPGVAAQAERDQPRVVGPPGGHPRPGREHLRPLPPARPGTNTAGHCRPLAACTVSSLTESDSPTRPVSRPNSSCSAAVR